ncbi:SLF2 protein, partial [Hylia prasina]|nr:SLF2 protein [Hylia prasina]
DHGHRDRTVLSSPDKGNAKDEGMGLSVLRTESFERNSSSPKKVRRKRCQIKHQISPVIGVFWKRIEEKDSVNMSENGRVCRAMGLLFTQKWRFRNSLFTAGSQRRSLAKKEKTA